MPPARENEPLIVVLSVGPPEALTSQQTTGDCHRGVHDEGGEDQQRYPDVEQSVANTHERQTSREKAERHTAHVSEEDSSRWKVIHEKPRCRADDEERQPSD